MTDAGGGVGENGTALKLCTSARLPILANRCFIIGEAKRADVIWSEGDFLALCEYMDGERPRHLYQLEYLAFLRQVYAKAVDPRALSHSWL